MKELMMHYTTPSRFTHGYLLILFTLLMTHHTRAAQSTKEKAPELQKLCMASRHGNLYIVKKCLRRNPTLINQKFTDTTSTFTGTALHYAVGPKGSAKPEILTYLINNGGNLCSTNHIGDTPLHCAVRSYKNPHIVEILVNAGSHLSQQNTYGETPLHYALFSGHIENITLLLIKGAPLDVTNNKGFSAERQLPNPKIIPRTSPKADFIAQLVRCARKFKDSTDKVGAITTPVDKDITAYTQQLWFRTLVETCELATLTQLHHEILHEQKNPALLETLLMASKILKPHTPKKHTPEKPSLKKDSKDKLLPYATTSSFHALLCHFWLKMPNKIIPYIEEGKLNDILGCLKIHLPSTKVHANLLACICKKLDALMLLHELQQQQACDVAFGFR